jgi:hypothetical protein
MDRSELGHGRAKVRHWRSRGAGRGEERMRGWGRLAGPALVGRGQALAGGPALAGLRAGFSRFGTFRVQKF